MNRLISLNAVAVLASALLVGCQSDPSAYQPAGTDAQVSATAAKTAYPSTMTSETSPGLFYNIADTGIITLYNPGDTSVQLHPVGEQELQPDRGQAATPHVSQHPAGDRVQPERHQPEQHPGQHDHQRADPVQRPSVRPAGPHSSGMSHSFNVPVPGSSAGFPWQHR